MAEDANYLRCEHGWKRDAWPADRDRCPHCTGTGEAPDLSRYQSPWRDTNVTIDIDALARTTLRALERSHCPSCPTSEAPNVAVDIHPVGHCADCRRDSVLNIAAAKPNTTHRMPEHEREYGG